METYRPRSGPWWTAAAWFFLAGLVVARGYVGGVGAALRVLPVAAGLGLLAWLMLVRPRVELDDDEIRLVNPLRTAHVPWAALIDVRTRYTLTLVTPHRTCSAFAAPGPSPASVVAAAGRQTLDGVPRSAYDARGSVAVGELPLAPSGLAARLVRRRWERLREAQAIPLGAADETPVPVLWWLPGLVGLAVAGVAAAVAALV